MGTRCAREYSDRQRFENRCGRRGVLMPRIVDRGGGQEQVSNRTLMIRRMACVNIFMVLGVTAAEHLHELGRHTLRTELEQKAAIGVRRHIPGRNSRPQQEGCGQYQQGIRVTVPVGIHSLAEI